MNEQPIICSCPKRDCPRHGDCVACREFHLNSKHPKPPRCERKSIWAEKFFGKASSAAR